jgi:hypothetical protein
MTEQKQTADRDEVLFAFHQACARPTVEQIIEWTRKFPHLADDIRAHAAVSRDWEARKGIASVPPSESELESAFSRTLSALYDAEIEVGAAKSASAFQSFPQLLSARGKDVPALAREIGGNIGIARGVLADLVNGGMHGPVGKRFLHAVNTALSITPDGFYAALQSALAAPRLGQAKANTTPIVNARSYDEVIRSSGMTPEQIRYWLDEG